MWWGHSARTSGLNHILGGNRLRPTHPRLAASADYGVLLCTYMCVYRKSVYANKGKLNIFQFTAEEKTNYLHYLIIESYMSINANYNKRCVWIDCFLHLVFLTHASAGTIIVYKGLVPLIWHVGLHVCKLCGLRCSADYIFISFWIIWPILVTLKIKYGRCCECVCVCVGGGGCGGGCVYSLTNYIAVYEDTSNKADSEFH